MSLRWLGIIALTAAAAAAAPETPQNADDLIVVDCLLPGQLRQLARKTTYLSARRPVKTTALDCRVRNGEYVLEDRANLGTALKVWLAAAEAGDAEAQTTLGEIFERGMGVAPDYEAAATWYRRAAEKDYSRAAINLGTLYEKGLGVGQDSAQALSWYRRAAGLDAGIALNTTPDVAPLVAAGEEERVRLRAELERLGAETRALRAELDGRPAPPPDPGPMLAAQEREHAVTVDALGREIVARENDIERLRAELEAARAALQQEMDAGTRTELASALERLSQREQTIAAQGREVETFKARVQSLEARERTAPVPPRDTDVAHGLLAGPEITLIDPVLPRTRGLVKVSIPAQLDRRRIVGRVAAPAGVLSLTVNELATTPNPAGVFTTDLMLAASESQVAITAIDRQGKRADVSFVLASSAKQTAVASHAPEKRIDFGTYHALLIGNDQYRYLPRLNTPGEDVTALDELLRTRFGFETTVLHNATRYEILSALNDVRAKLTSKDNLLLYYAGHGELDEVNMRGHWLPVDSEPNSTANWISNVTVTDILNVIKAKQILLVVDSCYSGTLTRSSIAVQDTAFTDAERETWLELMSTKRARVVLTSGGLAPVLDAGGGRHSVFAKALLDTLGSIDEITEGQTLYRSLAARVAHAAAGLEFEQTPQFAPIAHAGHESGDFFLLPR